MSKPNPITGRETTTGRVRGTTRRLDESARQLRLKQTATEKLLWDRLRGHKLAGLSFRRQHAVGGFVVDFACPSHLLVVEVDGSVHKESVFQDPERDRILGEYGWQVMRFSNDEIESDVNAALDAIRCTASARPAVFGREPIRHP